MNKITVLGRLTKDPEVRYTPSQKVVCSFTLAVDREFRNEQGQREADFIPVVVWGKTAEMCGNSLAKGHRLLVEGRLQIRNFEAKDGTRHWVTEIIASRVEFIERRSDVKAQEANAQPEAPAPAPASAPAPAPATAPKATYQRQPQQGAYQAKGSYQRQPQQGAYKPQQGSYQRQAGNVATSPFDEEVPF